MAVLVSPPPRQKRWEACSECASVFRPHRHDQHLPQGLYMQVFVFDLLPYGAYLDDLEHGKALPYPLGKDYFDPKIAVRTYAEHLDAWEELDRLGYDGV